MRVLDALMPLLGDHGQRAQVLSELASVTVDPARAATLRMDEARARALAGDAAGALAASPEIGRAHV